MGFIPNKFYNFIGKAERLAVRSSFGGQKLPEAETNSAYVGSVGSISQLTRSKQHIQKKIKITKVHKNLQKLLPT
jgi:hypothetical protein